MIFSPKTIELGNKIVNLTVAEAIELEEYMAETYAIYMPDREPYQVWVGPGEYISVPRHLYVGSPS